MAEKLKKLKFAKSSGDKAKAEKAAGSDGLVREKTVDGKPRYFAFKRE